MGWGQGSGLFPKPLVADHFILLRWLCSWAALFNSEEVPQCLFSSAVVWTLASILGHQTSVPHHFAADVPVMGLDSIFIITAEPD